jgi:hypothetical protein
MSEKIIQKASEKITVHHLLASNKKIGTISLSYTFNVLSLGNHTTTLLIGQIKEIFDSFFEQMISSDNLGELNDM